MHRRTRQYSSTIQPMSPQLTYAASLDHICYTTAYVAAPFVLDLRCAAVPCLCFTLIHTLKLAVTSFRIGVLPCRVCMCVYTRVCVDNGSTSTSSSTPSSTSLMLCSPSIILTRDTSMMNARASLDAPRVRPLNHWLCRLLLMQWTPSLVGTHKVMAGEIKVLLKRHCCARRNL